MKDEDLGSWKKRVDRRLAAQDTTVQTLAEPFVRNAVCQLILFIEGSQPPEPVPSGSRRPPDALDTIYNAINETIPRHKLPALLDSIIDRRNATIHGDNKNGLVENLLGPAMKLYDSLPNLKKALRYEYLILLNYGQLLEAFNQ